MKIVKLSGKKENEGFTSTAMTLTEQGKDIHESTTERNNMEASFALKEALCQAVREGRATFGAYQCAKQMQRFPDRCLYCVFPEKDSHDDMSNIERILMEAYCRENKIRIVRVDSAKKLGKVVTKATKKTEKKNNLNCVLVEKTKDKPSVEEVNFMETQKGWSDPWQVIEIPS